MKKSLSYIASSLFLFTFLSCEKKIDTIIDNVIALPSITHASLSFSYIHLDTTTNGSVNRLPNQEYQVFDTISLRGYHPEGINNLQVVFIVLHPRSSDAIARGTLQLQSAFGDSGIYNAPISFTINRGESGTFRVQTYAEDTWGNRSNAIILSLHVLRNNSKPRLSNLQMPDTLVRPTTGFLPFKFTVAVSDSDGYQDIAQVFFKQIFPTESTSIPLFDDGNELLTGDLLSGDGIFSRIVRIDSSNSLGERQLLFLAQDNSGALSDSLIGTFIIIE